MSENDGLLDEFLSEVNDKYYPQVMEGLSLIQEGRTRDGIEVLSRPLHTIKGVTGFMSGFEPASTFTHEVESFLKKLSAGEVEDSPQARDAAARAVTMVFNVIDQIKDFGRPSEAEVQEVREALGAIRGKGGKESLALENAVTVEEKDGMRIIRVNAPRLHLPLQREPVIRALAASPPGTRTLLDLSGVLSAGSALWEDILPVAEALTLAVCGLNLECRRVFRGWGFDAVIPECAGTTDFPGDPA